jgi:dTDP-4-amino-4,6-dideoxygalactose transaminase
MLGFNYRMTDIQAALGISQLSRLDHFTDRRNILARRYDYALKCLPLQLPTVQRENRSAFHLYVVRLRRTDTSETHRNIFDQLRQRGIGVNLHYMPVHLQPFYRELGFVHGQYPEAEMHGERAITLPLYAGLSDQDQDRVIGELIKIWRV